MRNDFESNYLAHHGILGMKWGKRNGPPYPLDQSQKSQAEQSAQESNKKKGLTDKQKLYIKRGAIAAGAAVVLIGGMYIYKKRKLHPIHVNYYSYGKKVDLSKLSDKVTTISKDKTLQRISSKSVEDYIGEGKSIYASYLRKDNHAYKEIMPGEIKQWSKKGIVQGDKAYVHKIKLKRNLKIASELDVAKAYMKVNNADYIDHGRFQTFMSDYLPDRKNKKVKAFVNELKAMGFDGIIDTNDAGKYAKSPLILLNPEEVIKSSKSHKLRSLEKFINVITY